MIKCAAFTPKGTGETIPVYEVPIDVGNEDISIELDCPPKQ